MQGIKLVSLARLLDLTTRTAHRRYKDVLVYAKTGQGRGGKTAVVPAHFVLDVPGAQAHFDEFEEVYATEKTQSNEPQIHVAGAWRVTAERAAELCGFTAPKFWQFVKSQNLDHVIRHGSKYFSVDALPLHGKLSFYKSLQHPSADPAATATAKQYQRASKSMRERADQRLACIKEWQAFRSAHGESKKSDQDFILAWNLKNKTEISRSSLYRWWQAFRSNGIDGLVERYQRQPKHVAEFTEEAKAYLAALYLDEARRDVHSCYQNLLAVAKIQDWKVPSYQTCFRYLQSFSKDVILLLREGKKSFEDAGFPAIQRDHESVQVGELYVADDRMVDVSFGDGKKEQRVWCTVWMDFRSKRVMSVTFPRDGNSAAAVLDGFYEACLIHIPNEIYLDNGGNYKIAASNKNKEDQLLPENLRAPIAKLLGENAVHWAISENARTKLVERIFAEMARVHDKSLPGYTGMNMLRRPSGWYLTRQDGGFLNREDVIASVRSYFFEVHNNRLLGNSKSPNQLWHDHFQNRAFRRADPEYLRHLLLRTWPKPIKIRANGIQFGKQSNGRDRFYWDESLQAITGRHQEVWVKYHEGDPEHIWIYALDGTPICEVPLYRFSKVPVLRAGEMVGEYFGKKRRREKEILAAKDRLNDLHGLNFDPSLLMQRADLAPEPEPAVNQETGEIIEKVEQVPLDVPLPETIEAVRKRAKKQEKKAVDATERLDEVLPPAPAQDQDDAWQRLFETL